MVRKFIAGRDFEAPTVVAVDFIEDAEALVAVTGQRKKARHLLGGCFFVHKQDNRLHDTHNEAIDAQIKHLQSKIKPTQDRINELSMMKEIEPYRPVGCVCPGGDSCGGFICDGFK